MTKNANANTATTNTIIGFPEIDIVVRKRGESEAKRRLVAKFGVAEGYKLLKAYNAISKAQVKKELIPSVWDKVLVTMDLEVPKAPEREEGNCLFLKPFDWFITDEGEVVPPGLAVKYWYDGNEYAIPKTPKEKTQNILECYHNTHNELVRSKFESAVTGYMYEDPVKSVITPREYYKNEPIFVALRYSKEVEEKEYDPLWEVKNYLYETRGFRLFDGSKDLDAQTELDEAEALLEAQRTDYETSFWGEIILQVTGRNSKWEKNPFEQSVKEAIENIKLCMKECPLKAIELTKTIAEQLKDMTDTSVHQKRCSERLEDPHCDKESYELDYEKRAIRIAPKEREFRWALKSALSKTAREVGADKYIKWLNKWAPTETARKVDVKKESFKVARAIGYKEACDYFFQKTFGEAWERELKIFLEFNPEGRNAYLASAKVCELIAKFETERCFKYAIQTALQDSTYDVFIDAYENFLHKELDLSIIHNWLKSTKLEKYDNTLSKIEIGYREAKIISLEQNQTILLEDFRKFREMEKGGMNVNPDIYTSLRKQLTQLSKMIEELKAKGEEEA